MAVADQVVVAPFLFKMEKAVEQHLPRFVTGTFCVGAGPLKWLEMALQVAVSSEAARLDFQRFFVAGQSQPLRD